MNTEKQNILIYLEQLKYLAIRSHYSCEDTFYSCPKSSEGCCNESKGNECDCGVDDHNKEVEKTYEGIKQLLENILDKNYKIRKIIK
jgi:hypothetical protein